MRKVSHATLLIPGSPVPWQRARRNGRRYFKSPEIVEWERRVQTAWLLAGRPYLDNGWIEVIRAEFVFVRPPSQLRVNGEPKKGAPDYPPRVDVDNAAKGLADSMNGHLWEDDSQIVRWSEVSKRYVVNGEEARTELEVRTLL